MADPRLRVSYMNITGPEAVFLADNSINLPAFSNGNNLSVSSDLSALVTVTSTSTYAAPNDDTVFVGKGVQGQRILGQVLQVEPEGYATVQLRGFIYATPHPTLVPIAGHLVGVDGNGRAMGVPDATALCANAVCLGFVYNHSQEAFNHLSGNLSVPTTVAQGPESVLIYLA